MRSGGLAVALTLICGGCAISPMPSGTQFTPTMLADLAKDPNTAVLCVPPVPPYFGGFYFVRQGPSAGSMPECGPAKITPAVANGVTGLPGGSVITIPQAAK